ncbi:ribonuclease H, partial [Trifolium pratense]
MLNSFWWGHSGNGTRGWGLLTSPNNLISHLFKARYFPRSDFLGANIGHNPSYVWRSIWSTKALIREGSRWCIGDGSSIPICAENWLGDGTQIPQVTNDAMLLSHMRV